MLKWWEMKAVASVNLHSGLTSAQMTVKESEVAMTNKRFIKTALFTTGFLCIAAAGVALVRVRAQVANVQPFVAVMVEEMAPRKDQFPTPMVRFQRIAVRSDGSISIVSKWDARLPTRVLYSREVIDATTKMHAEVEDKTRTIVNDEYFDVQVLQPGVLCDGKPAGQIEGFDVVYSEHLMESDHLTTHKQWQAPKLGCYPIVQEWTGTIHGIPMDTKQTLASIKLGEPDPWYFSVPADYTIRTGDEFMELMKPLLKQ
jgi:hypothetical protein